ncbi:HAD family hydrolase [Metabacillus endolithicus]|uniref:HAD family hydrolase n=1 Tax=Metabacillus endolithicus TaxID=1535204 RepID=A0ABW5BS32_9BACI|nr:HAD family hydrolase [Metabacillus endolithicus]UPG63633.1 HAD family hydrolase [Metabacillus endolithicus]
MYKAVVFDFDGLIFDTESVHTTIYKEMFESHNVEFPFNEWIQNIGTKSTFSIYDLLEKEIKEIDREQLKKMNKEKLETRLNALKVRPGVEEILKEAQAMNLKIGLASSSDYKWVSSHLDRLGLLHYFECIMTSDDVAEVKPHPELYLLAAKQLGVEPEVCIAFEDSANGSLAAKRAGLTCVIVPNDTTKHLTFPEVDYRLSSMADCALVELVGKLSDRKSN